ncbi:MAG TPA: hypothetical protein VGL69_23580 [Solirubrobacteraceae bacterium]
MSSLHEIEEIAAERNYYRDSVALLRVRLYRLGVRPTPRLEELQSRLESAESRLRVARAGAPRLTSHGL